MDRKVYISILAASSVFLVPLAFFAASLRGVSNLVIYIELLIIFGFMIRNLGQMYTAQTQVIYLLLFVIRIILLMYQSTYGNLPMAGGDSAVFHENALNIIENSNNNIVNILIPSSTMENRGDYFERMVALVYYLCGARTQYIYYVSYIASEIVFYYINKLTKLLGGDVYIAAKTSLLFYIWPLEIVYSMDYLREMTMQCIFILSLYNFLSYLLKGKAVSMVNAFFLAYVCVGIHSGMAGVLAAYGIALAFYNRKTQKIEFSGAKILLVLSMVVIFMVSPLWNDVMGRFRNIDSMASLANSAMSNNIISTTDYISSPSSSLGIVLQTPIRLFYFMVSPLIWQVRSAGTVIAMIFDGIPRLCLVYGIYNIFRKRNRMSSIERAIVIVLLLVVLCSHLIFSWGTNNYGTAMRHRLKVFPAEIILFNVFKARFTKENKNERIQI